MPNLPQGERELLKDKIRNFHKSLEKGEFDMYKEPEYASRTNWMIHSVVIAQIIYWGFAMDTIKRLSTLSADKENILNKLKYAGFMIPLGIFAMLLIPYSTVSRFSIIIKNEKIMAKIENSLKLPFLRTKIVPIKDLHSAAQLYNGIGVFGYGVPKGKKKGIIEKLGIVILKKKGTKFLGHAFNRDGTFKDPKLFDLLFYKPKKVS
ncbi:558_t:CDS:2 [Diversispora eburnea]|uniref:558_t:CDS:1 n=1 Tax=Diversispora eburnea TaxID=1213867 RepID=A0A9N8ZY16_9GLOM|nr:558_t:CDS:2 [Diversispora eburnea]